MVDYSKVKYRKGQTDNNFGHYVVADYIGDLYESKKQRKQYVEENGIKVDFDVGEK